MEFEEDFDYDICNLSTYEDMLDEMKKNPQVGKKVEDKGTNMEESLKAFLKANFNLSTLTSDEGEYSYCDVGFEKIKDEEETKENPIETVTKYLAKCFPTKSIHDEPGNDSKSKGDFIEQIKLDLANYKNLFLDMKEIKTFNKNIPHFEFIFDAVKEEWIEGPFISKLEQPDQTLSIQYISEESKKNKIFNRENQSSNKTWPCPTSLKNLEGLINVDAVDNPAQTVMNLDHIMIDCAKTTKTESILDLKDIDIKYNNKIVSGEKLSFFNKKQLIGVQEKDKLGRTKYYVAEFKLLMKNNNQESLKYSQTKKFMFLFTKKDAQTDGIFYHNQSKNNEKQMKIQLDDILQKYTWVFFKEKIINKYYGSFDNYRKKICSEFDQPNKIIFFESKNNYKLLYLLHQIERSLVHHTHLYEDPKNVIVILAFRFKRVLSEEYAETNNPDFDQFINQVQLNIEKIIKNLNMQNFIMLNIEDDDFYNFDIKDKLYTEEGIRLILTNRAYFDTIQNQAKEITDLKQENICLKQEVKDQAKEIIDLKQEVHLVNERVNKFVTMTEEKNNSDNYGDNTLNKNLIPSPFKRITNQIQPNPMFGQYGQGNWPQLIPIQNPQYAFSNYHQFNPYAFQTFPPQCTPFFQNNQMAFIHQTPMVHTQRRYNNIQFDNRFIIPGNISQQLNPPLYIMNNSERNQNNNTINIRNQSYVENHSEDQLPQNNNRSDDINFPEQKFNN